MDIEIGIITLNGETLDTIQTGTFTWTAEDLTLRFRADARWNARRTTFHTYGDTAQEALDNLITAELKASRKAAKTAALTDGQRFAQAMRAHMHINTRTRRYRDFDLHHEISRVIVELTCHGTDYGYPDALIAAVRPAFAAALSYDQHIASRRVGGRIGQYVDDLTPSQFLDLLAEMVDAGIIHTGGGERWFQALNKTLAYGECSPTGHQQILRLAA